MQSTKGWSPQKWAFFQKDLDRTDRRRTWRYQRNHRQTEAFEAVPAIATGAFDPAGEAACREFLDGCDDLVDRYRGAHGKTKRKLRQKIERLLARAGF